MEAFIAIVLILVCVLLIGLILLQKGRGGGLSNAFGGGAGGHSAFGIRTGDTLTWITVALVGLFLLLAAVAAAKYEPDTDVTPVAESAVGAEAADQATEATEEVTTEAAPVAEQATEEAAETTDTETEEVADDAAETGDKTE